MRFLGLNQVWFGPKKAFPTAIVLEAAAIFHFALWAVLRLPETYCRDLDFVES